MTRAARGRSTDRVEQPLEAREAAVGVPRPVEDHRLAFHERAREPAPEAAVLAVVAIVPHHEELALRHDRGAEVVARARLARKDARILVDHVRLVLRLAVDVEDLVAELDRLPSDGDAALDEVARRIGRL